MYQVSEFKLSYRKKLSYEYESIVPIEIHENPLFVKLIIKNNAPVIIALEDDGRKPFTYKFHLIKTNDNVNTKLVKLYVGTFDTMIDANLITFHVFMEK